MHTGTKTIAGRQKALLENVMKCVNLEYEKNSGKRLKARTRQRRRRMKRGNRRRARRR